MIWHQLYFDSLRIKLFPLYNYYFGINIYDKKFIFVKYPTWNTTNCDPSLTIIIWTHWIFILMFILHCTQHPNTTHLCLRPYVPFGCTLRFNNVNGKFVGDSFWWLMVDNNPTNDLMFNTRDVKLPEIFYYYLTSTLSKLLFYSILNKLPILFLFLQLHDRILKLLFLLLHDYALKHSFSLFLVRCLLTFLCWNYVCFKLSQYS